MPYFQQQRCLGACCSLETTRLASIHLPSGRKAFSVEQHIIRKGTSIRQDRNRCHLSAVAAGSTEESGNFEDLETARQQLSRAYDTPSISGQELRDLIVEKWGRSYDTRLHKRGRRMYLQIMWKFLEQRSFHLDENQYQAQLDAVAEYLTLWRVGPTVRAAIRSAPPRGPGYTGGGGARAVSIPLEVELDGARSGEWDNF